MPTSLLLVVRLLPILFSAHTAKWIVDKCFKGDLIKGRTVILVVRDNAMLERFQMYANGDIDT